jgi:outer membrane protein TolC
MKALRQFFKKIETLRSVAVWSLALVLSGPALSGPRAGAQGPSNELPTAPVPNTQLPAGITVERATPGALPLSLDDAIARGEKQNLQMLLAIQNERMVHGQLLTVENSLLPNLTAKGTLAAQQIDLAALGFRPGELTKFGIAPGTFPIIVKVNTAEAQISMDQELFNLPAYYLYRSAQKAASAANYSTLNVRGGVTLAVATRYLLALADAAQIENAKALEKADQVAFDQAKASHDAGVATNLDLLRAQVQLQTQQQAVINNENAFAKDKIALNRLIGLPADQELTLTDTAPYADLAELPLDDAKHLAFQRRKDLLSYEAQLQVAVQAQKAVKTERLPSLAFNGYYGVLGEVGGLYHGVFSATGKVSVPVFEEGQLRGEGQVAASQVTALKQQIDSLHVSIEWQIRSAMLDVESSKQLVEVARSNVNLASEEVDDATQRFNAGVDDNLPVVQAQAVLAQAQSQVVQTLYQYNQSKLQLARNTGVVETQYKTYLGR